MRMIPQSKRLLINSMNLSHPRGRSETIISMLSVKCYGAPKVI
jgi:hypothetical protein